MQSARKLVLVDEFDREYKRLQKPADAVAKANNSLQLSNTLHDQSLSDDQKVREYLAALHRFINVRKDVPAEPKVGINSSELSPPPPPPASSRESSARPVRRSRRTRRKRQRWEEY